LRRGNKAGKISIGNPAKVFLRAGSLVKAGLSVFFGLIPLPLSCGDGRKIRLLASP